MVFDDSDVRTEIEMFDVYRKEIDWGGRKLVLETGKVARQADGAVVATLGETTVLCTVVGAKSPREGIEIGRAHV